jgi:hypothetical protein
MNFAEVVSPYICPMILGKLQILMVKPRTFQQKLHQLQGVFF